MAQYLDYAGLSRYDGKIKEWSNSAEQLGFKTVIKTADGNSINFYKKPNATLSDTADFSIELGAADISEKLDELGDIVGATWDSVNKTYSLPLDNEFTATTVVGALNELRTLIVSSIAGLDVNEFALASKDNNDIITIKGIKEVDGLIGVGVDTTKDVTFAKIAATGAAEDVAYDNTTSGLTATDVQAAIDEVVAAAESGVESKTVYLQDESAGQSSYAKVYKLYQGANSPSAQTNPATLIGTINIPKDLVVQSGKVVTVTSGVDSDGDSTSVADGTYIKLAIQNQTEKLYINVADLVDVYTGDTTATATVSISSGNVITVDVIDVIYKQETSAGAGDGETVKEALTRLDGNDTTTGSVAKKIKDAINALDTAADVSYIDVTTATVGSTTVDSRISFKKLKEENGVISASNTENYALERITETEIDNLFS